MKINIDNNILGINVVIKKIILNILLIVVIYINIINIDN